MVLTSWGRAGALAVAGLLIALTAVYVGTWMYYAGRPAPATARLGIEYEFPPGTSSALITVVDARSPAAAAGLRPGDHLLAIEGEPAASERPFEQSIRFGQPGTAVRLTLRRHDQDEPIEATAVLAQPPPAVRTFDPQMITENVLRLYPLGFFAVVVVLLLQRPQDRNAWLVSLLFVGFIAAAPLDPEVAHPALRTFGMTFKIVFYTLVPAFFFYLFAVFPVRSPIDRRWPWLKRPFLALGSALAALLLARAVPEGSWAPIERTVSLQALTPVGTLLMAYAVAGIVLGATSLAWSYASTGDADVRRRIGVIVWGTAVSVTPFLVLQTIAGGRDVFSTFPFWAWAPAVLCLFLLPIAFVYAVVKY
ncbi:MAG TPA: PDZ domain-containing protein, partial [Vicinamibacterales bacterium]|nr:PDZ domain-containing protein [Vicinamibacterales bacterium]